MTVRRLFRFAEWTIGPARDQAGHTRVPVRRTQCTTCEQTSGPGPEHDDTDLWALRHAGLTGHRDYRELTTVLLTAHPAPTNPLYDQEQEQPS